MKKITALIVSFAIVLTILQIGILPVSADYSGDFSYLIENNLTATIYGYNGISRDVVIPSTIDDYPVTAIAMNTFINSTITRVVLPDTLTYIGTNAFRYCTNLTAITIPAAVTEIAYGAFSQCSSLAKVYFLGDAPIMGLNVFLNCASITIFRVYYQSESLGFTNPWQTNIVTETFVPLAAPVLTADITDPTDSTVTVTISYQGDEIYKDYRTADGDWTPYTQPIALTANNTVYARAKNINGTAGETASLEVSNIIFGNTDEYYYTIVDNATVSITTYIGSGGVVIVPNLLAGYPVTTISTLAFSGSSITGVVLPDTVTTIGQSAFQSCASLTAITIPAGITEIGTLAFSFCHNLKKVFFLGNAPAMGVNVFSNVASLTTFRVYYQNGSTGFTNPWLGNITTEVFTPLAAPTLSPDTTTPTNGTVAVTINFQGDEVYREYRLLNGNWTTYTGPVVLSENTVVYARAKNIDGIAGSIAQLTVNNIAYMGMTYSFSTIDNSAIITGYIGSGGALDIPETIRSFTVKEIAANAFQNKTTLTSVIIPKRVTTIGAWSFSGCTGLSTVTIGEGVVSIWNSAFRNCTSLSSVIIPNSVTVMGESVFFGCSSLTKAVFGTGVEELNLNTFRNCINLTRVILPESLIYIQAYNFAGCESLTSIVIPKIVQYIGGSSFDGCPSLSNAYFMGNAPSLGTTVFDGCATDFTAHYISGKTGFASPWHTYTAAEFTPLTAPTFVISNEEPTTGSVYVTVAYPASVDNKEFKLGNGYWSSYSAPLELTSSTTVNASYTSRDGKPSYTGSVAVNNIYKFEYTVANAKATVTGYYGPSGVATIPDTIDGYPIISIGSGAFLFSSTVTGINLPSGLTSIQDSAFFSCGLKSIVIPDSVTSIGERAFYSNQSLTNVTLSANLESIGNEAFQQCFSLTSITIPGSVTSISQRAFVECSSLTEILVDDSNNDYSSVDGVLFSKDETRLFQYPADGLSVYVVPPTTTSIANYAFAECRSLTSITIPSSVTDIGEYVFDNFDDLTIYCKSGSAAETYAINYYITYVMLPDAYLTSAIGSTTVIDTESGYIYGLEPGMTKTQFENTYVSFSDDVSLVYAPNTNSLGTGTTVSVVQNTTSLILETYRIIIFGDVNGDSAIDSIDAGIIVDVESFALHWDIEDAAVYRFAGNVNGDATADSIDAGLVVDSENYMVQISQTR